MNRRTKPSYLKKWPLISLSLIFISLIAIGLTHLSLIKFLITSKKEVFNKWYPHFGGILFYLSENIELIRIAFSIIAIVAVILIVAANIFYNIIEYRNFISKLTLKSAATYLVIILITLLIVEFFFRAEFHIIPGIGRSNGGFKKVNDLKELKGFVVDTNGIFKEDYGAVQAIENNLFRQKCDAYAIESASDFNGQLLEVFHDWHLLYNPKINSSFSNYCKNLLLKQNLANTDSAILQYSFNPINVEGFRSIPFKIYHTNRKRILLLGDSFTFGQEPQYIFQSFADYLLSKDVVVYNSGISSTDPLQYLAVAKKFVPLLHPDYVVINLCLDNDVFYYRRKLYPNIPIFYCTNAGDLYAITQGRFYYPTAKMAYDNILAQASIPAKKGVLYPFYTKTAIGTIVWQFLYKTGVVDAVERPSITSDVPPMPYPSCNDDLKQIKAIADSNNCKLLIVAIPAYTDTGLTHVNNYPNLLTGMQYYTAPVTMDDYETKTRHYNEAGHKKHGDFILKLIGAN